MANAVQLSDETGANYSASNPLPIALQSSGASADETFFTAEADDGAYVVDWSGGPGLLSIYGTWGTATVQLAYSADDGTTYIDTDGGLFSAGANVTQEFRYPAGKVRATIASASGPTSLTAKLQSTR